MRLPRPDKSILDVATGSKEDGSKESLTPLVYYAEVFIEQQMFSKPADQTSGASQAAATEMKAAEPAKPAGQLCLPRPEEPVLGSAEEPDEEMGTALEDDAEAPEPSDTDSSEWDLGFNMSDVDSMESFVVDNFTDSWYLDCAYSDTTGAHGKDYQTHRGV